MAARGFAFSSGCAAATTLLHSLKPGDHVISGDDVYGGTFRLFDKVMKPFGLESSFVDLSDLAKLEAAITPKTRFVWFETPTNPTLKLADIAAIAAIAKARSRARRGRQHLRLTRACSALWRSAQTWCCTRRPSTSTATRTWSAAP